MKIHAEFGNEDIAKVYVGEIAGKPIEFAESTPTPFGRQEKWVLIVSCLSGCPVRCLMCDAGQFYRGCLTKEEIFAQIDYLVAKRFPDKNITVKKCKIQFTRMGEPTFNPAVLAVLEELPQRYTIPGLIVSLSTIGPKNAERFLNKLPHIKNTRYNNGKFQLQFSVHTTDVQKRNELIPVEKMTLEEIAAYCRLFHRTGDKKITLNFIVMEHYPIDPAAIHSLFDPAKVLIKLTPLNPTKYAQENGLKTMLDPHNETSISSLTAAFQSFGFETIVSIGNLEENEIGSNCGQYVSKKFEKITF